MNLKFITLTLLFICMLGCESEAKVVTCSDTIDNADKDFFYCTKFAVGKGKAFRSHYKARFTSD